MAVWAFQHRWSRYRQFQGRSPNLDWYQLAWLWYVEYFAKAQCNTLINMSGETMVPEGLEWQSVEEIVDRIASIGFNFVRL
jgi:hypothetical protein